MSDPGFFVDELLRSLDVRDSERILLKHPFAWGTAEGAANIRELATAAESSLDSIQAVETFTNESVSARFWLARFDGREIYGASAALRENNAVELRIMLGSFPATGRWRDEVRRASRGLLPDHVWELPSDCDTSIPSYDPSQPLDARLPFEVTDDVVFRSPVLAKPVSGAKDVELVIGHAAAVYGQRTYGPRLSAGRVMLSFWTAAVSGMPIEVANLIQVDDRKRVTSMTMAMQPWPTVQLFRNRVRARTEHFMERSYFEIG